MERIPFSTYDFFGYLAAGVLVLYAGDYSFRTGLVVGPTLTVMGSVMLVISAYVLGHLIAQLSAVVLEAGLVGKVLKPAEETLFSDSNVKHKTGWARVFPGYFRGLPEPTQRRVIEKARAAAGIEAPGRALFLHCHSLVKRDSAAAQRLDTFLNLYGFCRNMSLALLLVAVALFGRAGADWLANAPQTPTVSWALASCVAALGMLYRYLKFFRLYTLEVFTTYAESGQPEAGASTEKTA